MAKGVQRTIETQIAEIETKKAVYQIKIDEFKAKIADLDSKIKELQESKKQKDLEKLLSAIQASGKTPEEVLAALNIGQKE